MKKLAILLLIGLFVLNGYYIHILYRFAKASEEYFNYLQLKTECLQAKSGMDQNDIYLASKGLIREKLKGINKQFLPVRTSYDTQNKECNDYAKYMCWAPDPEDSFNMDHCHNQLVRMGYSEEQIQNIKKNKSFKGIEPK